MSKMLKDPVCQMLVQATSLPLEYGGEHYAFCSEQCKFRFIFNPLLYVGQPGHLSPVQKGDKIIKCRRLKLNYQLDNQQADIIKSALHAMMGMERIIIEGDIIEIQYDLLQVTAEQISDELTLLGAKLGGGWITQLQFAFINKMAEIEIHKLEVKNN